MILGELFFVIVTELMNRQKTLLFGRPGGSLQKFSTKESCLHLELHISNDYFAIEPPKTPLSLRSSL